MKGVYVAKRSGASSQKPKAKSLKYKSPRTKGEHNEIASQKVPKKVVKEEQIEVVQKEVKNEELNSNPLNDKLYEKENKIILEETQNEDFYSVKENVSKNRKSHGNKKSRLGLISLIIALGVLVIFWSLAYVIGFLAVFILLLLIVSLILGSIAVFKYNQANVRSTDYKCALAALIISVVILAIGFAVVLVLMTAY